MFKKIWKAFIKNSIVVFSTKIPRLGGTSPPMPLTVKKKWHLSLRVITYGPVPCKRVEQSTGKSFIWALKSVVWCVVHLFVWHICCDTLQRAYFFWICKFALMMLNFCLFSVSKICILVVKFNPFLSLNWYKNSNRISKNI